MKWPQLKNLLCKKKNELNKGDEAERMQETSKEVILVKRSLGKRSLSQGPIILDTLILTQINGVPAVHWGVRWREGIEGFENTTPLPDELLGNLSSKELIDYLRYEFGDLYIMDKFDTDDRIADWCKRYSNISLPQEENGVRDINKQSDIGAESNIPVTLLKQLPFGDTLILMQKHGMPTVFWEVTWFAGYHNDGAGGFDPLPLDLLSHLTPRTLIDYLKSKYDFCNYHNMQDFVTNERVAAWCKYYSHVSSPRRENE